MTDYSLRVGIDISAYQASATWGTTPNDEQPVVEVEQSTAGYRHLIQQLHQTGHEPARCQVVMEATGTYWMRLAYTLHEAGFVVSVVNPVQAHWLAQAQKGRARPMTYPSVCRCSQRYDSDQTISCPVLRIGMMDKSKWSVGKKNGGRDGRNGAKST